ncbi:MAG: hypothetical protein HQ582_11060 [Planctomycetes bacterium]|nr:hypothetical protein [Planctomycetota bacterium]
MPVRTMGLQMLAWMALLGTAGGAPDDLDGNHRNDQSSEIEEGQPIHSGVVILDGRYLPLPYVVGRREKKVYINGHPLPAAALRGGGMEETASELDESEERAAPRGGGKGPRGRMGPRRFRGPGRGGRERNPADVVAVVKRQLMDDAVLIQWEDAVVGFIPCDMGYPILDTLVSDDAKEAKVQSLMKIGVSTISSAQWERLVDGFQPDAELSQRMAAFAAETERLMQQHEAARKKAASGMLLSSGLTYGINLTGILLGILALGSLLTHHPTPHARWREIDTSDRGPPLVVRNITLVVLLGCFDLACTLIAGRSGGFWELNPLAGQLLESPAALVAFKIPLLIGSAAILLSLRRYHGAQLASWWLCLVCTVLTFRWATYNSMFLS